MRELMSDISDKIKHRYLNPIRINDRLQLQRIATKLKVVYI